MIQDYWHCSCDRYTYYHGSQDSCEQCGLPRPDKTPQKLSEWRIRDLTDSSDRDIPKQLKRGKKARSIKWVYQGYTFDSTDEKERYLYLETLQERGILSDLKPHPETVVNPAVVVPANDIHDTIEIKEEIYTPDFAYRWRDYFILEDVKAPRFTKKRKTLKARAESSSKIKYRQLQRLLARHAKRVFMLTVYHNGIWHYFDCEQKEIQFSLEMIESEAA